MMKWRTSLYQIIWTSLFPFFKSPRFWPSALPMSGRMITGTGMSRCWRCVFQTSPCRHGETAAEVLPDKSWDLWGRFLRNGFQPDSCKKKGKLILERPFVRWCASLREFREVLRFEVLKTFVWCMFFCHQVSTLHLRLPGIQTDGIETCDTPLVGQESEILNLQGVGLGFHKMKAKKKAGQSKYIESSQPGMVSHRMGGWCSSSTLCSP